MLAFHCDRDGCDTSHIGSVLPGTFMVVYDVLTANGTVPHHFCSPSCLAEWAMASAMK